MSINLILNLVIVILLVICGLILWIAIRKDGGPYDDEDDWPYRKF
jgi:hypothetical protein